MDIDYYKELCERADYYGMDSLTEKEQLFLKYFKILKNKIDNMFIIN